MGKGDNIVHAEADASSRAHFKCNKKSFLNVASAFSVLLAKRKKSYYSSDGRYYLSTPWKYNGLKLCKFQVSHKVQTNRSGYYFFFLLFIGLRILWSRRRTDVRRGNYVHSNSVQPKWIGFIGETWVSSRALCSARRCLDGAYFSRDWKSLLKHSKSDVNHSGLNDSIQYAICIPIISRRKIENEHILAMC